jgi:hypothetical protein
VLPGWRTARIPYGEKVSYFSELVVGASGFEPEASCAQGRRATRLRYAPTVIAQFILKHFPTLLLVRPIIFTSDGARTVHE